MKRKIKRIRLAGIILIVLTIIGVTVSLTVGHFNQDNASAQDTKTVTVTRGNLSNEISASGNLELAESEDLAFQVAGTVVEVLVKAGDTVEEGQELAKLDTTEWDKQLKTLQKAVVTAQRNLTDKESAVTKAERQVTSAERQVIDKQSAQSTVERQVSAKELAVREAELSLQSAQDNLEQIDEVKDAQQAVDDAEMAILVIKKILSGISGGGLGVSDADYWKLQQTLAEENLTAAQEDLQDILNGTNLSVSDDIQLQIAQKELQVEKAQMAVEDAQQAVEDAKNAVEDAKLAVTDAEYAVEEAKANVVDANYAVDDAQSTLEDAQDALDEAQNLSPIITAPYDGFVPSISVKGGDDVQKGTVAMQIADPNKFEAEIMVSEMDISEVELGGQAYIEVDAANGIMLPATVTYISPTATIQSGVVNYKVTVEVRSVTTPASPTQTAADNTTMTFPSGNTDNMTRPNMSFTSDIELRQGLTVTVSLVVSSAQNVLLVPYAAISAERGQSYIEVVVEDGTVEKRAITTGITDYSYTEVTDGLTEGEKIQMSQQSTSSSTSSTNQQQSGGMMMPGMGGGPSGGPPQGGQ